ncbi:MAG: sigma-54 interaction domain-containing protein [Lysobacter sp.]
MPSSAVPELLRPMIGQSEAMQRIRRLLQRYAACDAPVLIEGETGTGKELAAREIHYASPRSAGPFVPVNCGALPDSLLESELFGHRRGAFTDARSSEPGLVEYARGGTLFLDEIDSLSPRAQTTLLRFLQNGEFRAVGERPVRIADVRVLAATNYSLADAVESGRFRRDLLYRLNSLQICLPPLRERDEDVMLLAQHLLRDAIARLGLSACEWTPEALRALMRHDWPGNVRELENVILRACMRADGDGIGVVELALAEPSIWGRTFEATASVSVSFVATDACSGFAAAKQQAIEAFERTYLIALMQRADGNVSRAAALSGTERRQLGKMLKRHGIDRDCARAD